MNQPPTLIDQRRAQLRGHLPAEEPGARTIEHVARNPQCRRQEALVLLGLSPATAVSNIYRELLREGQSPFALSAGAKFEATLLQDNARRLCLLYLQHGRLPSRPRLVDIEHPIPGKPAPPLQERLHATEDFLLTKCQGDPAAPHLLLHPVLSLLVNSVPHTVIPDFLVASDDDLFYRTAEIKNYPDRKGQTDARDLRSALRQIAVGHYALGQWLQAHGYPATPPWLSPLVDLVLKKVGSNWGTLNTMKVEQEYASLALFIERAPRAFAVLERWLQRYFPGAALDQPQVLDRVPNHYQPSCKDFCPLAPHCKREASHTSDLMLLGEEAARTFAAAGTIQRLHELLMGASPANEGEERLAQHLKAAKDTLGPLGGIYALVP